MGGSLMKKSWIFVFAASIVFISLPLWAQTDSSGPAADMEAQIQKLQKELNQLELQTEALRGKSDQVQKAAISLSGGTLEQDFESNAPTWTILQGQTLDLKFLAQPVSNVTGHFDLFFLGNTATDIFHYSYLPTLANENVFFVLKEADATFTTPGLSLSAFRGLGHAGWHDTDDDLYYLFPEQWDVDKPFRISGVVIPTGMEVKTTDDLEGLDIWAGQELNWGVSAEVLAKYKHNIGPTTFGVIDKVLMESFYFISPTTGMAVTNLYAPTVPVTALMSPEYALKPQNSIEAFWKIPVVDAFTADAVVLYSPYNANLPYNYVTQVAPGKGTYGTNYQVYQGTTNDQGDALGYQLKLTTHSIPGIDSLMVNGEYSGYIAGDLERVSGEITEVPAPFCLITADATVQKPLLGPNPLIYSGSPGVPLVEPRSEFDPFRVTMDPISGINNREMSKFSLSFVFNNGKGWFFRYNPNNFGLWNVNTDLDTDFSFGIIGTMFDYPTSTDLSSYVNAQGVVVWEGSGSLGEPPTDGYLPTGQAVAMWKTGDVHWIADLEGGYSTASLGQSSAIRSSTNFLNTSLTVRIHDTKLTAGYGRDVWGPEDWDVQFGQTIGQLFLAQISQKFGLSEVSLKYERWDNLPGDPYQFATINGINLPMDELYATYKLNF